MLEKSICGSTPRENRFSPQRHQADVSGPFTVAEQAALDPVGAGLIAQFRLLAHSCSAVVVRMQAQDDGFTSGQVRLIHSIESA